MTFASALILEEAPVHLVQQEAHLHVPHEHTNAVNRSFSDLDPVRFALASGVLCAARTLAQHPMTIALTRKQTCHVAAGMSTLDVLRRVVRTEGGIRSLTQGLSAMVIGCAVSESVYLLMIEYLREYLPVEGEFARDAGSAYAADATSRFVYVPMSIIAFRQMTEHQFSTARASASSSSSSSSRTGAGRVLRGMYQEGGMKSVFCGLGMTLMIGSQWSALWWATYIKVKQLGYDAASPYLRDDAPGTWRNMFTSRDDNVAINTVSSVLTSASTVLLFNPFFVLRINMQIASKGTLAGTARTLYRQGGWKAFFHGATLNMASSIVDGVLASSSYEYAKMYADKSRHREWSNKTQSQSSGSPATAAN